MIAVLDYAVGHHVTVDPRIVKTLVELVLELLILLLAALEHTLSCAKEGVLTFLGGRLFAVRNERKSPSDLFFIDFKFVDLAKYFLQRLE